MPVFLWASNQPLVFIAFAALAYGKVRIICNWGYNIRNPSTAPQSVFRYLCPRKQINNRKYAKEHFDFIVKPPTWRQF